MMKNWLNGYRKFLAWVTAKNKWSLVITFFVAYCLLVSHGYFLPSITNDVLTLYLPLGLFLMLTVAAVLLQSEIRDEIRRKQELK
jgi:uncharacterized membrane protein